MIKSFRQEFFDEEAIKRIDVLEQKVVLNNEKEKLYFKKEKDILSSNDFDENTKKEMIKNLQNEIFGNDGQIFRDRLNLRLKRSN